MTMGNFYFWCLLALSVYTSFKGTEPTTDSVILLCTAVISSLLGDLIAAVKK